MSNPDLKVVTPLWIWKVFAIVLLVLAAFLYVCVRVVKEKEFASRTAYLNSKLQSAGNRKTVLIIGTSLTQCAFESSGELESCLKKGTAETPVVVKLWRSATSLETTIDAMPALQTIRPDVLVIEANMLLYSTEGNGTLIFEFQKMLSFAQQILFNLTRLKVVNLFDAPDFNPDQRPQKEQQKSYRAAEGEANTTDTTRLASFCNLAAQLHRNGTKIILLNIPIIAAEEKKKWTSPDTAVFNRNFKYIRNHVPYQYFNPEFRGDLEYYLDRGHMNSKGREIFSGWFCNKLSQEL